MTVRKIGVLKIILPIILGLSCFSIMTPTSMAQSYSSKTSSKKRKTGKGSAAPTSGNGGNSYAEGDSLAGEAEQNSKKKYILGNIGLSPQPLIGIGATGGILGAGGRAMEADFTIASGKKGVVSARIIHIGARYRLPLLKMGYYAGGVGLRMAAGAWNVLSLTGAEYPTSSSLNAITLDGAVGAQTKFGSFIVSADVLGISFPLLKLGVKKSALQEEDVDTEDEKTQQKNFDALAAGINKTILKVGVGINL